MYNFLLPILTVIQCAINADSWKQSLPVCVFGMLGIFIVIGVIVLLTYLLNKATSKKPKDKELCIYV